MVEKVSLVQEEVNSISFNQEQDAFTVATNRGFWVYKLQPQFQKQIRRSLSGGLRIAQMIGNSNLFLLVATGDNAEYQSDQVLVWDDKKMNIIQKVVAFESPILQLSFSNFMYVVGTKFSVKCFAFNGHQSIKEIETGENPRGVHAVSYDKQLFCVAAPHRQIGQVHLMWYTVTAQSDQFDKPKESFELCQQLTVEAHENSVVCLALNNPGTILATASDQGTLVRLHDTKKGTKISELRRGSTLSTINYLSFDQHSNYLTCCSAKTKIHIFIVPGSQRAAEAQNTTSYFSYAASLISVAGSEWSNCQFVMDEGDPSEQGTKAVVINGALQVLTKSRKYYRANLLNRGQLKRDHEEQLLLI